MSVICAHGKPAGVFLWENQTVSLTDISFSIVVLFIFALIVGVFIWLCAMFAYFDLFLPGWNMVTFRVLLLSMGIGALVFSIVEWIEGD